jgi:fibronectin type 3 domain-containing protein
VDSSSPPATASSNFSIAVAAPSYAAVLNWTASTSSDVTGYNVYRSTVSGGSYSKINSSLVAGSTYTDSTVVSGNTYYYVTASVDTSGIESLDSNEVQAVIP